MSPPEPFAGELLAGRFRVERVLGRGGMGLVLAAHHVGLDQRVALKLMLPKARASKELGRRFLREARAAARLRSQHATRVIDVGTLDDGAPFIVMEYLDGTDVATLLRDGGPFSAASAAALVLQASQAIGEAHTLGIIHRDLKPANLFVTRGSDGKPMVKVLDLGICKLIEADLDQGITTTAGLIGTPAYMAPEQMRAARSADARSDIWSLGVILHQMVTGSVPFSGESIADLCLRAALEPCPPLPADQASPAFAAVVARCLEKDPAARFQSIAELAAALAPCADEGSFAASFVARRGGVEPTLAADLTSATRMSTIARSSPRRRRWLGPARRAAGLLALAGLVGFTVLLTPDSATRRRGSPLPAPTPALPAAVVPPAAPPQPAPVGPAVAPAAERAPTATDPAPPPPPSPRRPAKTQAPKPPNRALLPPPPAPLVDPLATPY